MSVHLVIEHITKLTQDIKSNLVDLLIATVNDGASVGFLSPLSEDKASEYWSHVLDKHIILLIAKQDGVLGGTIQIQLCNKENGLHRAEITKLMVHPNMRRKGIARQLLVEAERIATNLNRTLLVLDTREGDISNTLYLSENYIVAGIIPQFSLSSHGKYEGTVVYYKIIN